MCQINDIEVSQQLLSCDMANTISEFRQ